MTQKPSGTDLKLADNGEAPKVVEPVNRLGTNPQTVPDPFDPERYRLPQDFSAGLGVKKVLTTVPVRKPGRQEFARVRPGEEWRLQTGLLIDKVNRESYLIDPSLAPELAGEITVVCLLTAITRQKVVFLWPINLAGIDGRTNPWHEAALAAARRAETRWIRLAANMAANCYDVFEAAAELSEPEWPEETTFRDLLKLAFQTRIIESLDHPVLRALRGEA